MGRKGLFAEKPKKGPGRKAKKQGPPVLSRQFKAEKENKDEQMLSHRQKQRLTKRLKKQEEKKIKMSGYGRNKDKQKQQPKKKYNSDTDEQSDESDAADDVAVEDVQIESDENETRGFTDENSEWLKPTKKDSKESSDEDDDDDVDSDEEMVSQEEEEEEDSEDEDNLKVESLANYTGELESDDSEDNEEEDDDDEDEDDDSEDLLPIEKKNRQLKLKQKKDAELAEDEMQLSLANQEVFEFPDDDDDTPVTLQVVQQRIKDVSAVLADFNRRRLPNKSRQDYLDLLRKDLCIYYSYNDFLMEKLMQIFSVNELFEYLEASEVPRPLTIRTNSLKTRRRDLAAALINRGVNLDPLGKWTKIGLVVYNSNVPLGATPEYLAGHYMIQGASSMLPVMALAPQENERILDLCAAPGGKSSHIAALMKNTGVLFSNDANRDRIKAVVGNFHRLGIMNAIVSCEDGCKYKSIMTGFDRTLVDAPCTGTGVISKDPSAKTSKSDVDVQRCYNIQRKLLLTAIDCTSAKSATGGYIVYSTCSILPEENEWVIDYALKKRNVKLVPTGLDFGTDGFVNYRQFRFHPTMKLTRRYYPHTHNMDGFFVAKLKKFSDVIPVSKDDDDEDTEVIAGDGGDDKDNSGSQSITNGDDNTKLSEKANKLAGKPAMKPEEKKRKLAEEQKKYVAKVFEKPQKIKKVKKQTQNQNTSQPNGQQSNSKMKMVKTPKAEKNTINRPYQRGSDEMESSPIMGKKSKKSDPITENNDKKPIVTQISKKKLDMDSIPMEQAIKLKTKREKLTKKQIGNVRTIDSGAKLSNKKESMGTIKKVKKLKKHTMR